MSYRAEKMVKDGRTGATAIPRGQNWPRVKMPVHACLPIIFFLPIDKKLIKPECKQFQSGKEKHVAKWYSNFDALNALEKQKKIFE